jgi:hypothetical protein
MLIFRALSAAFGGGFGGAASVDSVAPLGSVPVGGFGNLPGFASGGSMRLGGRMGTDTNVISLNGVPIARTSYGEMASFGDGGGRGFVINQTFAPNFSGNAATRDDLQRMALMTKAATIQAIEEKGRRRGR